VQRPDKSLYSCQDNEENRYRIELIDKAIRNMQVSRLSELCCRERRSSRTLCSVTQCALPNTSRLCVVALSSRVNGPMVEFFTGLLIPEDEATTWFQNFRQWTPSDRCPRTQLSTGNIIMKIRRSSEDKYEDSVTTYA
jgi:hypothetical protein